MVELTDALFEGAVERGRAIAQVGPRAAAARYDAAADRIVVELTNGCSYAFPPHLAQGLEGAAPDRLADVAVIASGHGLHWDALDVDFTVPGLLAGIFGTRAHMRRGMHPPPAPAGSTSDENGQDDRRLRPLAAS